nr:immunoglobulin heavy chain junction region [Macaca mulatta]MOV87006.1 immunoglobulin heavy chain junction region [Macaca mulatta]MOV87013.1 immunoglobulin heavy chain junction region [Macaca mulatta]MOV87130.1 immunoglobulin heavy chain junction region [Macaca mulatta]MOV87217.1 immunoglobulin heavy chain junction region [Macaca mulatta]
CARRMAGIYGLDAW